MDKITMQDIMKWQDIQRDVANARLAALGDGDESRAEHSPEAKAVRIINAITERLGEMTAVEYLKAKQDMCISHTCDKCPLASSAHEDSCRCTEMYKQDKAIRIMKKWKEEYNHAD